MYNYYDDQLVRVLEKNPKDKKLQIKISGENHETHWLDLNNESIESLEAFLKQINFLNK